MSSMNEATDHSNAFQARIEDPDLVLRQNAAVTSFRNRMPAAPTPSSPTGTTVLCRSRPVLLEEVSKVSELAKTWECVTTNGGNVYVHKEKGTGGLSDQSGAISSKKFVVHASLGPTTTEDSVFTATVRPLVTAAIEGGNGCCIAYGQTGSGKTHTMQEQARRAVEYVYKEEHEVVSMMFYELRGSECMDVMHEDTKCPVRTDENGVDVACGLETCVVEGEAHLMGLLETAAGRRSTASTRANEQSSRSHAFCELLLSTGGKLLLVDLAGSESKEDAQAHAGGADADLRLKEMVEINQSLSVLKECIRLNLVNAKSKKGEGHVPYRRSILTRLLKRSIDVTESGASSKTCLIVHVAPLRHSLPQTINTLTYAEFMIAASRASTEKAKFKGPEAWSSKMVSEWVDGKYKGLGEYFVLSGKQLFIMWKGDVDKRVIAAGWTQADADEIYDTFRGLVAESKRKNRASEGKKVLGTKKAEDVAVEIVEGPKNAAKVKSMYGAGLAAECVENS